VRKLLGLASLSLASVLVLAPDAFAQGSFCTTTAKASGESVAKCVDAPSLVPSVTASPEVTLGGGGTPGKAPTATSTAGGITVSSAAQAVGGRLPPTGGGPALVAAALLLGSGVLSLVVLRRGEERPG
jgi:hypothetical protein